MSTISTRQLAGCLGAVALAATACTTLGSSEPQAVSISGRVTVPGGTVVLLTHDSFAVDKELLAEFEAKSGYRVETRAPGDAGSLVNQLVLTKETPLGDAVYGIDNAFASRALEEEILAPYASPAAEALQPGLAIDDTDRLTPIDYSDVCINVDREWFAAREIPEPQTLDDLADPAYRDLLVVTDPATSSPGLAFLLATIDAYGEDWTDYWARLRDNGVEVRDSWSDAYFVDFSGAEGKGPRPLVLSYASSPPYTVGKGDDQAPTRAMLDTCFRQVEYAGVLAGAENPEGGQALVDFLLSRRFQADLPEQMYVYPARADVRLPVDWQRYAPRAEDPHQVSPADIDAQREEWIQQWSDTVVG